MKKILIKSANKVFNVNETITKICFSNVEVFRNLCFNMNDEIIFSEDNIILDNEKSIIKIYDSFKLELNNRKNLNNLYKELYATLNEEQIKEYNKIEINLQEYIENVVQNVDYPINYKYSFAFNDLLSMFDVKFKTMEYENYLEYILSFIKICYELNKSKLIISINLMSYFSEDEEKLLKKELKILQIPLIDFSLKEKKNFDYYFDEDMCMT